MGLPEDAAALLLAQTDLPEPAAEQEAAAIHAASWRPVRRDAMVSTDPVEAEALFDARRLAYPALRATRGPVLTEDVCLPRGRARRDARAASRRSPPRTTSLDRRPSRTRATATCTRC